MPQEPKPPPDDQNWGKYLGYGLQVLAGVGLGVLVGQWVDRKYRSDPWGVLVGSMLGLASGMYLLIKDAVRMNRAPPRPGTKYRPPPPDDDDGPPGKD